MSAGLDPLEPLEAPMGRRVGRFLLVCLLVTVLVAGITLWNAAQERQRELAGMIDEAEAAGHPLNPAAFEEAYHAGKPAPNAADVYLEALAALGTGEPDEAVELAVAAAPMARARFPLRFQQDAEIPFNVSLMRDLSHEISPRLAARLADGDRESARALLEAQFALAESLDEGPLLILQTLRGALLRQASDDLAAVFASGLLDASWRADIEARLEAINPRPAMVDALAAERAVTFAATLERTGKRRGLAGAYDLVSGSSEALLRGVLVAYGELIAAVEGPAHFRGTELERLSALPASLSTYERMSAEAIMRPALRIVAVATEHEGLLAAAEGACVVERYRLTEGDLPQSEAELAQRGLALPADPLGSGAVRYESGGGGGYRLWSVGLDGLDDGGAEDSDDIVFTVGAGP